MNMREIIDVVASVRLDELHGVKGHIQDFVDVEDDDLMSVVAWMEDRGFTCLGAGSYGAVFDTPEFRNRYVLKLYNDPGYDRFVNFCKSCKSQHLPRFIGKVMPIGRAKMVRVERLTEMPRGLFDRLDLDGMVAASWAIAHGADRERYAEYKGDLFDVLVELQSANSVSKQFGIDLPESNFMMRNDVVVISDPLMANWK